MEEINDVNKKGGGSGGTNNPEDGLKEMLVTANARVAELEKALSAKENEFKVLRSSEASLTAKIKSLDGELTAAIKGYRTLAAQANPDILPELLHGETVQAIEESVKQGKEIVDRVKQGLEAEIFRGKFPVGAPERGRVDTDLSPREKIQQGISTAKQR
jgi:hypothetical protein